MNELTLYNLMSEDMTIWTSLQGKTHVNVKVQNEEGEVVYAQVSHIYAWESLVSLARQVLACDERLRKDLELELVE